MIESYDKVMTHITSNGWPHQLRQTCYKCSECGQVWEPTFYGEDGRWWNGSWNHKCPKKPVAPPVPPVVEEYDQYDF